MSIIIDINNIEAGFLYAAKRSVEEGNEVMVSILLLNEGDTGNVFVNKMRELEENEGFSIDITEQKPFDVSPCRTAVEYNGHGGLYGLSCEMSTRERITFFKDATKLAEATATAYWPEHQHLIYEVWIPTSKTLQRY